VTPAQAILKAARTWLKAFAHPQGTALTDAQVIAADAAGANRPPLPYLAVKVTTPGMRTFQDEPVTRLADALTVVAGGVEDDVYEVDVSGDTVSYTRLAEDTDATVAAALRLAILAAAPDADVVRDGLRIVVLGAALSNPTAGLLTLEEDVPVVRSEGRRQAVISVHGFGAETEEWLEEATLALAQPSVGDVLDAAGLPRFGFVPRGAINNDTLPLDSSMQPRFLREFEVAYRITGRPVEQVELALVEVDATFDERAVAIDVDLAASP
jgi:hypothetical protein